MKRILYSLRALWLRLKMALRLAPLRWRGAKIGRQVWVGDRVTIERKFARYLEIEDRVQIGEQTHIILHDASVMLASPGHGVPVRFSKVTLKEGCVIGHRSTILCGVTVGAGALVGACSLVTKDVPPGTVVMGVPARVVMTVEELRERYLARMERDLARNDGRTRYWHFPDWEGHRIEWSGARASLQQFLKESDPHGDAS